MALEIIVNRDPDGETTLYYFKDGAMIHPSMLGVTEFHVDPGRSGDDPEWVESMRESAASAMGTTGAFIRALVNGYTS